METDMITRYIILLSEFLKTFWQKSSKKIFNIYSGKHIQMKSYYV